MPPAYCVEWLKSLSDQRLTASAGILVRYVELRKATARRGFRGFAGVNAGSSSLTSTSTSPAIALVFDALEQLS